MRGMMVAGNWKMNGSQAMLASLLQQLAEVPVSRDVVICPPYPYLAEAVRLVTDSCIAIGAQNSAAESDGAFTGEVSANMLADSGCRYVILGHSERRALYAEDDDLVLKKTAQALNAGLDVILCVGETLEQRQAGMANSTVARQLQKPVKCLSKDEWKRVIVAYEPVWAIGTGETATPDQAQDMHHHIRSILSEKSSDIAAETRLLYGGSVKASNAADLFQQPDIDGALVGGASLDAEQFLSICNA